MQEFNFAPITLLTGVNNSGKSSLIKSILLLKESYSKSPLMTDLLFTEQKHNLGSFSKSINNKSKNQYLKFKLQFLSDYFTKDCSIELEYVPNSDFKENGLLHSIKISSKDKEMIYIEHHDVNSSFPSSKDHTYEDIIRIDIPEIKKEIMERFMRNDMDHNALKIPIRESGNKRTFRSLYLGAIPLEAFKPLTKDQRIDNAEHTIRKNSTFNSFNHIEIKASGIYTEVDFTQPIFTKKNNETREIASIEEASEAFVQKFKAGCKSVNVNLSSVRPNTLMGCYIYEIDGKLSSYDNKGMQLSQFGEFLFNSVLLQYSGKYLSS
ncbi:MAG: hypothetical protein ACOH2V_13040 [Candidatus Saccharimonadaceae bacterium]